MTMAARRPNPTSHVFSTPQSEVLRPRSSNNSNSVHISAPTRSSKSDSNARGNGRRPPYAQNSHSHSHYHYTRQYQYQHQNQYQAHQTHQYHNQVVYSTPPSPQWCFPSKTLEPKRTEPSNVVDGHNSPSTYASSSSSSSSSSVSLSSSALQPSPGMSSLSAVAYTGLAGLPLNGERPDGVWKGFSGEYTQNDWDIFSKNAQIEEKNKREQSLKPLPPPSHSLSTSSNNSSTSNRNNSNNHHNNNKNLVNLDYGGGTANIQLIKPWTKVESSIGKPASPAPHSSSCTSDLLVEAGPTIDMAPPQVASTSEGWLLDLSDQDAGVKCDTYPSSALTDLLGLEFPVVIQEAIPNVLDLGMNQGRRASDSESSDCGDEGKGDNYHVNLTNGIGGISISDDDGRMALVSDNSGRNNSNESNSINNRVCDNNRTCDDSFLGDTIVNHIKAEPQVTEEFVRPCPNGTSSTNDYNANRGLDYETHDDVDYDDNDDDDYDDDDEDDEMDDVWKQLDNNKVVLTLTTMSRIKDDLEAENITWSELRMQRL